MRRFPTLLLALAPLLLAAPAKADVYKCTINGEVRYQDAPCPGQRDQKPHLEIKERPAPAPAPVDEVAAGSVAPQDEPPALLSDGEGSLPDPVAAPAPAAGEEPPPDPRITQLAREISAAQLQYRGLLGQQRVAEREWADQFAGREDSEEAQAAMRKIESDARRVRIQAADRERALQGELARLCPNGTLNQGEVVACR